MGEPKVLNEHYQQQLRVRMMLPMTIRCNTCGNYMNKGTEFHSRKEDVIGETYLGIRFYIECTNCSAEITFKTDPHYSDYTVESGATLKFDILATLDEMKSMKSRLATMRVDSMLGALQLTPAEKRKMNEDELGDAMLSSETRTSDCRREMDILAALDEMRSMKSRHATMSVDSMLEALQLTAAERHKRIQDQDEALIKSMFQAGT